MSTVYYKGPGVLPFGGRDYRAGDELPSELGSDFLGSLIAKGKASTTAPAAPRVATDEVAALRARVKELEGAARESLGTIETYGKQLVENKETIEQLNVELATVRDALTQANETIEQLTAASLNGGQAGPKGAKK